MNLSVLHYQKHMFDDWCDDQRQDKKDCIVRPIDNNWILNSFKNLKLAVLYRDSEIIYISSHWVKKWHDENLKWFL